MSVPAEVKELGVSATATTWAFDKMTGVGTADADASKLSSIMGKPAPDFELQNLEGETFKLSENTGKEVLVLDFWATWCGPCIKALPEVMAAVKEFDEGVRLVTVNQQENPHKVRKFLETRGWPVTVVMDEDLAVREKYGVEGIPTTVIIGKDGVVKMVHSGFSPGLKEELVSDIKKALQ